MRLSWTDKSNNEAGFRIERSVGAHGRFVLLKSVGANLATYTDKTVAAGTVYRYRVLAHNAAGSSAWSSTITVVEP